MNRIRTIIEKEWAEVFKNRVVLFTVILLPLLFTALPLVMLVATGSEDAAGDSTDVPTMFAAACGNLSGMDCLQVYLVNQFLLLYLMMPMSIPVAIAAYSIVGEKTTHSLEPLLATPVTTEELLVGKSLAAALPAIAATWICFGIFVAVLPLTGVSQGVIGYILGPTWLLAILLAGPLMAVMAVNFALLVSSRVSDPRVAEQVSMVIILPLLGLLFGQLAGVLIINVQVVLLLILGLVAIDAVLVYLGARLFQRETILTRWK
jgi:ABC-2 type transport system permease protein